MTARYENPLRMDDRIRVSPDPVSVIIFGVTGDLAARKLLPALFALAHEEQLPAAINIVGYSRREWDHDRFRNIVKEKIGSHGRYKPEEAGQAVWDSFSESLYFVGGTFDELQGYKDLDEFLKRMAERKGVPDNRLYYLSAPPGFYDVIVKNMHEAGIARDKEGGWRRIIIEKPFGHDLPSAHDLNQTVLDVFEEHQVYRIDHYLGKETVQNILVMRFANAIYEPVWNRRYVDHVQISVAESGGVGGRAGFYDDAGVVRDIFQNHILQVLSLVAMEPPVAFDAGPIRDEKVKVLRAVRTINPDQVSALTVRGQYGHGVIDGQPVPAYLEEDGIPEDSQTATYAAFKWYVDNWRWQGVPFYVRSGKRLTTRATEVSIHFKQPPHLMFDSRDSEDLKSNVLTLRIQPDEGISQRFEVKLPGQGIRRRSVTMDFRYRTSFGIADPPEAYERLLLDAMLGDATLFARRDEIEYAWSLIDPILEGWKSKNGPPLEIYEAGSWGPSGSYELINTDGRTWRRL